MSNLEWTVDAHCHWSDARVFSSAHERLKALIDDDHIEAFLLGGVDPEEWKRQTELQRLFPKNIFRAFALHPYFVDSHPRTVLESGIGQLEEHLPNLDAVGEIGLDFRPQFQNRDMQLEFFERQLKLAATKPVILHVVRAHEEALRVLKKTRPQGMVHAFTGSPELAKRYLDLGLYISVGAKLMHAETHSLHDAVKLIPLENLLIESDCPDQPPPHQLDHDSSTVWAVARIVAELKKLSFATVVEQTRRNLFSMLKKEFTP